MTPYQVRLHMCDKNEIAKFRKVSEELKKRVKEYKMVPREVWKKLLEDEGKN